MKIFWARIKDVLLHNFDTTEPVQFILVTLEQKSERFNHKLTAFLEKASIKKL